MGEKKLFRRGLRPRRNPIMVPKGREESVDGVACTVSSLMLKDIFVVVLADILIDCACTSVFIVVVSDGDDEIGIPALHKRRHVGFGLTGQAVISDNTESDGRLCGRPRRKNQLNRGEQNETRVSESKTEFHAGNIPIYLSKAS